MIEAETYTLYLPSMSLNPYSFPRSAVVKILPDFLIIFGSEMNTEFCLNNFHDLPSYLVYNILICFCGLWKIAFSWILKFVVCMKSSNTLEEKNVFRWKLTIVVHMYIQIPQFWCSTNNNESTIMKIIRYLIYWLHRYAFLYFIVYISLWMKFASVIIFPKIKIYSVFLTVGETRNIVPWKLYKSTTCSCILPNKSMYNQIKKKNSSTLKKGITWVSNSNHQLQY